MKVTVIGEQISQEEIDAYIEHSKKKYADKINFNGVVGEEWILKRTISSEN